MRAVLNMSGRPVRIPAAPVAEHLRSLLDAGMGWTRITRAGKCSTCTIARILNGQELIRRTVADRLLAITYRPAPGRYVEATGTRRRIQALIAIGNPVTGIAAEAEVDHSVITDILNGCPRVRGITFDRIAATYDWLAHQPPVTSRASSATACRNRGRREGWRDPQWWDDMGDIDDPDFDPNTAERPANRDELSAYRLSEIAHLTSLGVPKNEIATRLGMNPDYVRDLIRDEVRTGQAKPSYEAAA
ncbi:hypothetical protein ACFTXJ_14650 [Streptomyces zhihengii]|uniref:hypothetical protein n=1 Tax=Streptomyces zhihengii TaxID=1818004 RepID=UPI003641CBAE